MLVNMAYLLIIESESLWLK